MAVLTLPHAMCLIFSTLTYPILLLFFFKCKSPLTKLTSGPINSAGPMELGGDARAGQWEV